MLTSLGLQGLNRVLRSNDWALQRLRLHAGKTARVVCPPLTLDVEVQPGGELEAARMSEAGPHVVVRLTPGALLRLLSRDPAVWSEIAVEGDSEFATALNQIWQQLDWGFEEDLSHLFGDIAAHRIAGAARQAREGMRQAFGSALRNGFEFWTEERPVVALRRDIESYSREVDALRDDAARLEKRIAALEASATPGFGAEYGHNHTDTADLRR